MRVAMYYRNNDIRVEEVPKPTISFDELLVKAMACGICGSDVMEWYRIKKSPRVLGHEMTGEIAKVGKDVKNYRVGDRVFVSHHVPCNSCHYCLDGRHTACETLKKTNFEPGGLSEFVRVPKENVESGTFLLPDEMTFGEGTFIEPLGCVIRAQRRTDIKKGYTVLVLGSGISGILHIQLARYKGAGKIIATDIDDYRLNEAKKFGAHEIINAKEDVPLRVKELNEGRLADRVIICTGAVSAFKQALKSVDGGGSILFFAPTEPDVDIPISFNELWMNQIELTTTYAAAPLDIEEAIELIHSRKVNVLEMITHRLSLAETGLGFQIVAYAKESLKTVIEPYR